MKHNRNPLAKAINYALGAGMVAGLAMTAAPVSAQDEEGAADLDRVQVTGSRIARTDLESSNPVTLIDRDEIERTQAPNLGELLQRLVTENSGSPINTAVNNGGNGGVFLDLRGFGRTLTLINGQRPLSGDFQAIPAAMVERIEILKTGASAIYGVDAVAGVVNVITRRNFTGVELNASYQWRENVTGGGDNWRASTLMGIDGNRGYGNVGFEFAEQKGITQGEVSSGLGSIAQSTVCFPPVVGIFDNFSDVCAFEGDEGVLPFGSSRIPEGMFFLEDGRVLSTQPGTPGTDPNNHFFVPQAGLGQPDAFNFAPFNFLQTPFKTFSSFGHGGFEINEHAELYSEFRFTNRKSAQLLAPMPYDSAFDPAAPLDNNPGEGIPASNFYNPFDQDILLVRRRVVEGERRFSQNVDQFQAVAGVKGSIPGVDSWFYDFSYNYSERNRTDIDEGQFIGSRLERALGPSFQDENGNIVCGTPGNVIDGCVPLNMFGGPGSITPEMLNYVSKALVDSSRATHDIFNLTVDGSLVELPAGTLQAAFGVEYRQNAADFTPDSGKATESVSGNTGDGIGGRVEVEGAFAEFLVPLLADMPGAEKLDLRAAVNYSDFTITSPGKPDAGFDNTSAEVGLEWRPFADLMVRGTWGEVFTAPGIGSLFSPQSDSFPTANDPCSAAAWDDLGSTGQQACLNQGVPAGGVVNPDPQPRARVGGNPDLGPESGETITFGLVYQPGFVDGLNLTADYWEIDLDDAITGIGVQRILEACIRQGGTGEFCDRINRLPMNAANPGEIDFVVDTQSNIGNEFAKGVDFSADYRMSTDSLGMWSFGLRWSHLLERTSTEFPGEPATIRDGRFDTDDNASYPKNRANLFVDWTYGDFGVSANVQHISGITAPFAFVPGSHEVDSQQYLDLGFSYFAPFGSEFTLNVDNVTDEDPPWIEAGFNANTDTSMYRPFGRMFSLRWKHAF